MGQSWTAANYRVYKSDCRSICPESVQVLVEQCVVGLLEFETVPVNVERSVSRCIEKTLDKTMYNLSFEEDCTVCIYASVTVRWDSLTSDKINCRTITT